jgi:hypothetical protein
VFIDMHPSEEKFYLSISKEVARYALGLSVNERFLLSTPQRLLTSSFAAASAYWSSKSDPREDLTDDDDLDLDEIRCDTRPLVARLAELSAKLGMSGELRKVDTKYALLREIVKRFKQHEKDGKLIIFSSFRVTLEYLQSRLNEDGVSPIILHGGVKGDRDQLLSRFRDDKSVDVLLSSEVGSEGIDLQFCWTVINYDLPWNPMRLEQRIGRVDRLGQEKDKVIIHNLVYENTIDGRIYHRLYERLDLCRKGIGEFEAILGAPIREMTAILMNPLLTAEEQDRRIEQTALALENRKAHQDRLEEEAAGLVAHGDFILRTINAARKLNRSISGTDVLVYVQDRLRRSFQGSTIEPVSAGSDIYEIRLTDDARIQFGKFLVTSGLQSGTRILSGASRAKYHFTPSVVASRRPNVENVSHTHPLVRFCAALDDRDKSSLRNAAIAAVLDRQFAPAGLKPGCYCLAVQRWSTGRSGGGDQLGYAGCEVSGKRTLPSQEAEELTTATATHGRPLPNASSDTMLLMAAAALRDNVLPTLREAYEAYLGRITAETEDRVSVQRRTLERHRETQLSRLREIAQRHWQRGRDSLAKATEGRIEKFRARCDQRQAEIDFRGRMQPSYADICAILVRIH